MHLLKEVCRSRRGSAGAKVVLVVDALDEAEAPKDPRTNPLRPVAARCVRRHHAAA
jgi:hypothetical protein